MANAKVLVVDANQDSRAALAHALTEAAHDVAELVPQILLLAGFLAHLAGLPRILFAGLARLAALLPHAILLSGLSRLTLRAKALVEQLLLALHQILQPAHHLLRLIGAALHLAGPRGAQVFQHVLHLRQELARLVARAAARHLAGPVEHALKIAAGDHLRGIGRLHRGIGIALQFLGE